METVTCNACGKPQSVESFNWKNKAKGVRHRHCKVCKKGYQDRWYAKHKETHRVNVQRNRERTNLEVQNKVCEYLTNHPCVDCGEKDIVVLQFDHTSGKKREVSVLLKNLCSWTRVLEEIVKCQVRCANCHMRKTAKQFGWYKISWVGSLTGRAGAS